MDRKIFSIAPSFDCSLSCHGCYLTTGVTTEMRDLTKDDYYWRRAMEEAYKAGYREFAITLNPFPGAIEHTAKLAQMAKKQGFEIVNVTTVWKGVFENFQLKPLLPYVDIISLSVDDMRCKDITELYFQMDDAFRMFYNGISEQDIIDGHYNKIHLNINLLWTPTVFSWAIEGTEQGNLSDVISRFVKLTVRPQIKMPTIQHLIYKPLSIYESVDWFWEKYNWILENRPEIKIHGDGRQFIGDAALNNMLGLNECPGEDMFDIDPMGFARKCPENPIAYNVTTIDKLTNLFYNGIPNCGESECNCITER